MARSKKQSSSLRIAAIVLTALCLSLIFLVLSERPTTKDAMTAGKTAPVDAEVNTKTPRPVPSLFRSPSELSSDHEPSPAAESTPANHQNNLNQTAENPFIIGSKRTDSADSALPSPSSAISGDNEDRVRVRATDDGVRFFFNGEQTASKVSLVGSFNSWESGRTLMNRDKDGWSIVTRLAPIRHEFKFVNANGIWYPQGANLILDLGRLENSTRPPSGERSQRSTGPDDAVSVAGDHQGRVRVFHTEKGARFSYRDDGDNDYILLLGDFNSWNHTVGGMRREGDFWVATKSLPPGDYSFKFLGPDENWFPQGENLTLVYRPKSPYKNVPAPPSPAESQLNSLQSSGIPDPLVGELENTISSQKAKEYLNDAGLYEGKPGVWFFPQSNRLVIRQYGRIAKDPKIRKSLKKLGDRLPNPAEMENPPPQRR